MSEPKAREPFDAATDSMVFYAFRYCLGRQTYVISECVEYLVENWHRLSDNTRTQIKEILGDAGIQRLQGSIDSAEWAKVLEMVQKTNGAP
jgi:hypothetical protein